MLPRLKRVMFWFHHGVLADNGGEATTCYRIAQKLVEKGQLKPEAPQHLLAYGLKPSGCVSYLPLPCPAACRYRFAMPRKKLPEHMTAEEELRTLVQWADEVQLENVAAALRRILTKIRTTP